MTKYNKNLGKKKMNLCRYVRQFILRRSVIIMNKWFCFCKTICPLGAAGILACIFTFTVNADSTITLPVTDSRQFKLILRIPPDTEPLTREQRNKPLLKKNRIGVWYDKPFLALDGNDEMIKICRRYMDKGWVKILSDRAILRNKSIPLFLAIRIMMNIIENIIEIGKIPNLQRAIKRCNLTVSDIEDIRRMLKRFENEVVMFGGNPNNLDKDLLVIQESFKEARKEGILKVIKVEGKDDGSTLIHLSVE